MELYARKRRGLGVRIPELVSGTARKDEWLRSFGHDFKENARQTHFRFQEMTFHFLESRVVGEPIAESRVVGEQNGNEISFPLETR